VVLFYSTLGGSWAVMASDFVQGLIMVGVSVLVSIFCLVELGGFSGLIERLSAPENREWISLVKPEGAYPGSQYTWAWHIAMAVNMLFAFLSLDAAPRYFAVKDGREASRAGLLAFLLYSLGLFIFFIPPWTAHLLYADQVGGFSGIKAAESSYAVTCLNVLPNGLIGLVIVAIFSATLSSMDVGVNRNAAMIVKDIFPPLFRAFGASELLKRRELLIARVVSVVLGLMSIGIALYFTGQNGMGMFETANLIGAMITLPMLIPMLLGLFVKKAPPSAALWSVGIALLPSLIAFKASHFDGEPWSFQKILAWVVVAGVSSFLASTLFWRKVNNTDRERVNIFFQKIHTPVDFAKEVGEAGDANSAASFVGIVSITIGALLLLLLIVQDSVRGYVAVISLSVFLIAVGGLLYGLSRKSIKRLTRP
ncbi:MAG: sodium:solute symporter family transporter, partial [Puniceicoccales bacterium]